MPLAKLIIIPFSKKKNILLAIASIGFIVTGILFILFPEKFITTRLNSPVLVFIVGIACTLFFSVCAFYILKSLFSSQPGLIIDHTGIQDNSSGLKILWIDIQNISSMEIYSRKLIMIEVSDPQKYINMQSSTLQKKAMQMNLSAYGAAIIISVNSLQIRFEELYSTLHDYLKH